VRVLVTGGAGYIGATTAAALLDAGHTVTVADDLSRGHRTAVPSGATFIEVDVTVPDRIDAVVADGGFDACLHFAALIEAGESMRAPERFFRGQHRRLGATCSRHCCATVSSGSCCPRPRRCTASRSGPDRRGRPLNPTNAYGESKLLVERMLAWHHRIHGLNVAALRYFNAAGADPGPRRAARPGDPPDPAGAPGRAGQRDHIAVFGTDYPTPDGTCGPRLRPRRRPRRRARPRRRTARRPRDADLQPRQRHAGSASAR
jgi:UDP-glucose 4-epimerase